jgi:peptidylprolyl isomerase
MFVALAACGGGSSGGSSSTGAFPTVSGSYGDKPSLKFSGKPGTTLEKKVLKEGTGAPINKGDLMVADYLGQVFNGSVFDNSYDKHQPFGTPIGAGKVIAGWDESLVGVKAGSRVLLVIPPDKGYGPQGNSQAGIKGTDTLVFVIDVITVFGPTASGDAKAVKQTTPTGGVTVGGKLGAIPTVAVTKGTAPPKKPVTVVIAKGSGPAVKPGFVVVQFVAVTWVNKPLQATWTSGSPAGVAVGAAGQPNPFDLLIGIPIGSRVLLEIPQQAGAKPTDSVAVVVDIVAQPSPAKDTAS